MKRDEWIVTNIEERDNGTVRVRGVHATRGPFVVTIPLAEYATMGVWAAVRTYYEHHPAELRRRP